MDVFIVQSNRDNQIVTEILNDISRHVYNFNPLVLKNGNCFWKIEAKRKIKRAQMVVFFLGELSHQSPYIGWELKTAIKYNKPVYTIKLSPDFLPHPSLLVEDPFTEEKKQYDKELSKEELIQIICNYNSGNYPIFNDDPENLNTSALMDQYKLFLQTSETLVSRRQSVNSFYISVNSAIVAIFGSILALCPAVNTKMLIGLLFVSVGTVLCISWIKILDSYGDLNSSKMKIISCIEKQLPASLYDAEWAALSDKLNRKKYVSFTNSEKRIPKIFLLIYFFIFIGIIIASLIS